ncbi:MAG: V-type ATP synthase subunit D [Bacillota bacterium]|nr:V-type ATP synthase subunit D [Bacillota bacterium]
MVNPTRMELTRLKRRLVTARRGHKLLKDKRDELMKQFLGVVRENRDLRSKVEDALSRSNKSFSVASAVMSPEMLDEALLYPKQSVSLELGFRNVMSVNVPLFTFHTKNDDPSEIYPYGFAQTSGELDDAVFSLSKILNDMLRLAEIEKSAQLLAQEIEKTRRRVNALEYVMIPQLEETISYIMIRLQESERGNLTRLMKVKDIMLAQAQEGRKAENA